MLVQAINMISSPELRNASTLGGDLLQEVWCQYLRGGYSCWRNGGHMCYGAIGDNSYYHSAMGGRLVLRRLSGRCCGGADPVRCLGEAGHARGDQGADHRATGARGHAGGWKHPIPCGSLQRDPDRSDPAAPKPSVRASFEKLRPRGVWDFAMASLALSLQVRDNTIEDARVVFGGIAGKPLREQAVENFLKGKDAQRGLRRSGGCRSRSRTPRRSNTTRPRSTWPRACWLRAWRKLNANN